MGPIRTIALYREGVAGGEREEWVVGGEEGKKTVEL